MWPDQSQNGLNTYQNGSSGFQMDVKGRADVGYSQLHDTKNTKTPTNKAQTWPQILI